MASSSIVIVDNDLLCRERLLNSPSILDIPTLICSLDLLAQPDIIHLQRMTCAMLANPFLMGELLDALEALFPSSHPNEGFNRSEI